MSSPAPLRFLNRLLIWGREIDIGSVIVPFCRETSDDPHVLEAGGEQRHREAALNRHPRGLVRKPHRHIRRGLLAEILHRSVAIGLVELLVGIGECRENPAASIFPNGVYIDVRTGDLDFRQLDAERAARAIPAYVALLQLRQVELVANVAW